MKEEIIKIVKQELEIYDFNDPFDYDRASLNIANKISSQLEAQVSQDFWRIFTRKLNSEYGKIRRLDDTHSILIKKILEPFIDALIKTEQQIDDLAKNSG